MDRLACLDQKEDLEGRTTLIKANLFVKPGYRMHYFMLSIYVHK